MYHIIYYTYVYTASIGANRKRKQPICLDLVVFITAVREKGGNNPI